MKTNKFFVVVTAALLTLGGASMLTAATYSQPPKALVAQAQPATSPDCSQEQADSTEAVESADTDTIDLQCGDQNEADDASEANSGPDTDDVQEEHEGQPDDANEAPGTEDAGK